MPSIRQLQYLVTLSEELHFRRAAERVNVTQPTLSMQIQQLEKRLKVSLVERGSGSVTLTPLGREVAERARRVLAEVKDIVDLATSSQHGLHGTVRLGVAPTLGPYLLPHIVPELHASHPDLRLYVREDKPGELQAQLQSGTFDLIISPLPINQADLEVERMFREPLLIVAAHDHPLARKKKIAPDDLKGVNILTIEKGHHLHEQVRRICDEFGAIPMRDYEGTSLDTLRLMVGMGVGVAFLPALYVRSEIGNREEVATLAVQTPSLHRQVGIAWRKRSVHADKFSEVAELIRKTASHKLREVTVIR
ncbi:MAG: hydrogen peroxide-inducible genes activator [Anderseniella sp.]